MEKRKTAMYVMPVFFALCLVFLFAVKPQAAETGTGSTVYTLSCKFNDMNSKGTKVGFIMERNVNCPVRVGIFNTAGKMVYHKDVASNYVRFNVKKNQIYTYKACYVDYSGNQITNWTKAYTIATVPSIKVKRRISGSKKTVTVTKMPKVKGIKEYYFLMSTKKDGKYTKVKTVKPGKPAKISQYKKKNLKSSKTYYMQIAFRTTKKKLCVNAWNYQF